MRKPKWVTKVGVELTWVPNVSQSNQRLEDRAEELSDLADTIIQGVLKDLPKIKRLGRWHPDLGCIELSTRVLSSYAACEAAYKQAQEFMSKVKIPVLGVKFLPRHASSCGCGGHIHVDLPKPHVLRALLLHWAANPWLGWAFSHPEDDLNCRAMMAYDDLDGYWGRMLQGEPVWMDPNSKSYAIRVKGRMWFESNQTKPTLEFRAFDSAKNWREQEEHLMFVQAYMGWIAKQKTIKMPNVVSHGLAARRHWVETYPQAQALEEFQGFIKELGLPWARYRHFTQNIRARYARKKGRT